MFRSRGSARAMAWLAAATATAASAATAQPRYDAGASDTEIRIGNTAPYSGPVSAAGVQGKAEAAFFRMINDRGGINGRKVTFISYDDGFNPAKTLEQTRKLVESDEVLAVFGALGTATNAAVQKYLNQKRVPQLFVASGGSRWADPKAFPWTIGWSPGYQMEARAYAKYILAEHPAAKIGVLFQNDDYGKDYVRGLREGLGDKAGTMIVAELPYEVNDATIESQLARLKSAGTTVFVDIATQKFAAQAIRKMAEMQWQPVHILNNLSASISAVLKPAGLEASTGIISATFYKDPADPQWRDDPAVAAWNRWMDAYDPGGDRANPFNVYGYLIAETLAEVLARCGGDLTRTNVMKQATSLSDVKLGLLLPGIAISTGPADYHPIKQLQLMRFNGERWELFGTVIDGSMP